MSTATLERVSDLPRTALLTRARPTAQRLVRSRWRVEQHHAERVPRTGPVVLAANHVGWLDGPLLAICAPRPVHAWTKVEMFAGRLGGFLLAAGQIPLDRDRVDTRSVRSALACLEQGGVVGVFPEGLRGAGDMASTRGGAAYLALVSGAPVVPVAFLGTREPGGGADALPPRGARIAMTYGAAIDLGRHDWPRTQAQLRAAHDLVTRAVVATVREAERTTGLRLPGPLGPDPTTSEESTTHD